LGILVSHFDEREESIRLLIFQTAEIMVQSRLDVSFLSLDDAVSNILSLIRSGSVRTRIAAARLLSLLISAGLKKLVVDDLKVSTLLKSIEESSDVDCSAAFLTLLTAIVSNFGLDDGVVPPHSSLFDKLISCRNETVVNSALCWVEILLKQAGVSTHFALDLLDRLIGICQDSLDNPYLKHATVRSAAIQAIGYLIRNYSGNLSPEQMDVAFSLIVQYKNVPSVRQASLRAFTSCVSDLSNPVQMKQSDCNEFCEYLCSNLRLADDDLRMDSLIALKNLVFKFGDVLSSISLLNITEQLSFDAR
jgi:hypothetical protein